jgi:hypothetical protein
MVKNVVFLGCSSLSAKTYSSLTNAQKFITLRPFIISESVNNCWKSEKLFYIYLFKPKSDSGRKGSKSGNLD